MSGVEFLGETFGVPDGINQRRLLRIAGYASKGGDSDNLPAMAELDKVLAQCVRPEDADRFDDVCDAQHVTTEQLFEFVGRVAAALAERPTVLPSASSDGPSSIPESSVSRLEELATERFPGRPDLYLAATAESRATA